MKNANNTAFEHELCSEELDAVSGGSDFVFTIVGQAMQMVQQVQQQQRQDAPPSKG